jgi:hypothetical protein
MGRFIIKKFFIMIRILLIRVSLYYTIRELENKLKIKNDETGLKNFRNTKDISHFV